MSGDVLELVLHTSCEKETEQLGQAVGEHLFPGAVVLLEGELGAGKTVFARGLARGAGVQSNVASPTFTLLYIYQGRLPFYHFDLYRLCDEEELFELGLDEYLYGDGLTVVEWAARFPGFFPAEALSVTLSRASEDGRTVHMKAGSEGYRAVLEQVRESWGSYGCWF